MDPNKNIFSIKHPLPSDPQSGKDKASITLVRIWTLLQEDSLLQPLPSSVAILYLTSRHLRTYLSKSKGLTAPLYYLCYHVCVKFLQGWSWRQGQGRSQPHPVLGERMICTLLKTDR